MDVEYKEDEVRGGRRYIEIYNENVGECGIIDSGISNRIGDNECIRGSGSGSEKSIYSLTYPTLS